MERASTSISERVAAVQGEIAAACRRTGRSPDSVTLVAVSKQKPATAVRDAIDAGLRHFGENRLEEAVPKMAGVEKLTDVPVTWHMVGTVQSRKARYLTAGFGLFHALGDAKLAGRLSRILVERECRLDVLLEMNVSGEASKQGWNAHGWQADRDLRRSLWDDVARILALPGLTVRGLMTMAPIVDDAERARPVFVALRDLRDALARDFPGAAWDALSMGMTDDYPVAVEEGATYLRIGRAIFGARS